MFSLDFLPPAVANFLMGKAGGLMYEYALVFSLVAVVFAIILIALA